MKIAVPSRGLMHVSASILPALPPITAFAKCHGQSSMRSNRFGHRVVSVSHKQNPSWPVAPPVGVAGCGAHLPPIWPRQREMPPVGSDLADRSHNPRFTKQKNTRTRTIQDAVVMTHRHAARHGSADGARNSVAASSLMLYGAADCNSRIGGHDRQ